MHIACLGVNLVSGGGGVLVRNVHVVLLTTSKLRRCVTVISRLCRLSVTI